MAGGYMQKNIDLSLKMVFLFLENDYHVFGNESLLSYNLVQLLLKLHEVALVMRWEMDWLFLFGVIDGRVRLH